MMYLYFFTEFTSLFVIVKKYYCVLNLNNYEAKSEHNQHQKMEKTFFPHEET